MFEFCLFFSCVALFFICGVGFLFAVQFFYLRCGFFICVQCFFICVVAFLFAFSVFFICVVAFLLELWLFYLRSVFFLFALWLFYLCYGFFYLRCVFSFFALPLWATVENSNKNLNFPMRCTVVTILHDHDVINNVLFSFARLLQYNYCTAVTLVHQDYLDTINVSVLYVITGSIFI